MTPSDGFVNNFLDGFSLRRWNWEWHFCILSSRREKISVGLKANVVHQATGAASSRAKCNVFINQTMYIKVITMIGTIRRLMRFEPETQ